MLYPTIVDHTIQSVFHQLTLEIYDQILTHQAKLVHQIISQSGRRQIVSKNDQTNNKLPVCAVESQEYFHMVMVEKLTGPL